MNDMIHDLVVLPLALPGTVIWVRNGLALLLVAWLGYHLVERIRARSAADKK